MQCFVAVRSCYTIPSIRLTCMIVCLTRNQFPWRKSSKKIVTSLSFRWSCNLCPCPKKMITRYGRSSPNTNLLYLNRLNSLKFNSWLFIRHKRFGEFCYKTRNKNLRKEIFSVLMGFSFKYTTSLKNHKSCPQQLHMYLKNKTSAEYVSIHRLQIQIHCSAFVNVRDQ